MNNKQNYRSCVGGIILLVTGILGMIVSLISNISTMITNIKYMGAPGIAASIPGIITTLVGYVPLIIFAVMLVMKKHGKGLTVVALIAMVLYFLNSIIGRIPTIISYHMMGSEYILVPVTQLVESLVYTLFLLSVVLLCAKATGKNPDSARKMGILPGVMYIVYTLFGLGQSVVQTLVFSGGADVSFLVTVILTTVISMLIASVLATVAWFLACSWIANPYKKEIPPRQSVQNIYPQGPNGGYYG